MRSRLHILIFPCRKFIRQRCPRTILLFIFNFNLLLHKLNQELHGCQFQAGFIENYLHSICRRRHCSSYPNFRHWETGKLHTDLRAFDTGATINRWKSQALPLDGRNITQYIMCITQYIMCITDVPDFKILRIQFHSIRATNLRTTSPIIMNQRVGARNTSAGFVCPE